MNKLRGPKKNRLISEHTLESPGVLSNINLWDAAPESDVKAPQDILIYGQG